MEKLFEIIDSLAESYTEFLTEICNIESKSEDKAGIDRVCESIVKKGRGIGFDITEKHIEKAGNVASLTYNKDAVKPHICVSAHMDTVFKSGEFGYSPTHREGNLLKGPGVVDCKGGIAVGLLVMEALKRYGYKERPIKLILQSEEEIECVLSGGETLEFLREEAKGAEAFFNLEFREEGKIMTKRKGIIRIYLDVKGKSAHAGHCFDGRSAIREAAYKIIKLENLSVKDKITYNCGIVEGGTALNVVPDSCRVYIDIRVNDAHEYETAMETVKKIASVPDVEGTTCEVVYISDRKPMERTPGNVALFEKISEAAKKYGLGEYEETSSNGGSDAAYSTIMGIPTVDGLGPIGKDYHSKAEWCLIPSIAESAKIIAAAIIEIK